MVRKSPHAWMQFAAVLTAAGVVFVLDRALPDGLGIQVLYLPLIVFAAWKLAPGMVWLLFGICAGFTIMDCELEWNALPQSQLWVHLVNDAVLIIVGFVVTALALARNRYIQAIREAHSLLRQSEEQLRRFVEQVPAAVAMFDRDMRYLAHSRRWVTDLHIPPINLIGRCHYDDVPNFPERWKDDHRRALQGEMVQRDYDVVVEFNGRTDYSRSMVHPWFTFDGQIGGVVILVELITERILLEHQLRDSEALYRSLVENVPQCVFRKNLEGRFTFANRHFCEAVGRSVEQVLGTSDFDHCPLELAAKYRSDDRRVAESGETLEIVEDLQAPNGELRHLQTVKTPVVDAQGHVVGTQGIFWDITEKRRAEEAIRRSEREFRMLAENLPDIVARFDQHYRHLYVNRTVQSITGLSTEEFLGKTNAELGMPDELVHTWHAALRVVFDTAARQTIEFAYHGCEALRHFESRLMPELAPDGSVESVLVISRDVTERVRAQEQAQLHLTELAHTTRLSMIGGLVSEIAHEINQPLHAIANYSQAGINVLEKTPADQRPNLFNWLKQIFEQSQRAAEIIRQAGRFVRKAPTRRLSVNINRLVRDSLLLANFDLRLHRVMLRCELADNTTSFLADAVQIQQVLMNLLRNAVEAVSQNPEENRDVLVRTEAIAGGVQVSVHDNGRGLGDQNVEKVFEPFFTTKSEGMGLGLAVCRSIVQAHQGRMWAENNPDSGATFYFTLPVGKEEPHDVYCHA